MRKVKFLFGILFFVAGTISCLKIRAQKFYSADKDNPTGNNSAIKKRYIVEKINDSAIVWGVDTIKVSNFSAFTQVEFHPSDFTSKILFIKNEIDSSLYINNKTGKALFTTDLKDTINADCLKLINVNSDTFTLLYNDSVTLVKSNRTKEKAFVTIPIFFEKFHVKDTLKRGIDSLAIKSGEKYLYNETELKYCYIDSFLAGIIADSTWVYSNENNNEYLIFDANKIPSEENKTSALLQWLVSGFNWLWLVISLIVIGLVVFVLVILLKNNKTGNKQGTSELFKNLFKKKSKTNESKNVEKVKFLHNKENRKAIFQLAITADNKEKLLKELSIKQVDIQQMDKVIHVPIALQKQQWGKGQNLQKLNDWLKNRCTVELFCQINNLSDYRAIKDKTQYLVLDQNKLAILEKYAENPAPIQEDEQLEKQSDNIISNNTNFESEKDGETPKQQTIVLEEKTIEEPKIETPKIEEPKQQLLSEKLVTFMDEIILKDQDESKTKETFESIKSFLLEFQKDLSNTESENNFAIHSYSQQIEKFKKEQSEKIAYYKTAMGTEKENAVKQAEEKIIKKYSVKAGEKETEIAILKESHNRALLEKEEENKKKSEKIKEETEKEWKAKLEQKDSDLKGERKNHKADVERLIKENKTAITEEKKEGENAVKAEQEKSKRYQENVIFADELKPYSEKVLSLLEMGDNLQTECNKLSTKEKSKTNAASFLNRAFAKFQTATFILKSGDWREQLNNIVYNGTLIVPPPGKENNHSSVYATIRQAIKEDRSKEQRIEAFQKGIAIALLNRYSGALLVLVEDMKVLADNKISLPREIDELRKTLRLLITKELGLKINDIALLEKLNNNNEIEVVDEVVSSLTKDNDQVVEVLFYGVGRDRVDKTQVVISK